MTKKILLSTLLVFAAVSAKADNYLQMVNFLGEEQIDVERPLFNIDYSGMYKKVADTSSPDAYFEMGLRYYYGYVKRLDVPYHKDYVAAAKWFYEAGMKGHTQAAYYLGNMYSEGKGVAQNFKAADWWYNKAIDSQFSTATYALGNMYTKLYFDDKQPESVKKLYLTNAKSNYTKLLAENNPYAYFNLALLKLKTEEMTRFLKADVNNLLQSAFSEFVARQKRYESYEILKIMKYLKLDSYQYSQDLFNSNFKRDFT